MKLIGISGKKRSGKDTVALMIQDYLKRTKSPYTYKRIGFADALYIEVAKAICPLAGTDWCVCKDKVAYMKEHKDNFRLILQGWGTDYRRLLCRDSYWIEQWLGEVALLSNDTLVVVPDVRFRNEYDCIIKVNGVVWRVDREVCDTTDRHPSEIELDGLTPTINNNGTLADLQKQVEEQMKQL